MSIDSNEPRTTEKVDQTRIDRRTAMKAALGGAVAAAAWSAPKIEGLSLSPDYASAGSRTTVTRTLVNAKAANNGGSVSLVECVGTNNGLNSCGPWSPTTLMIPIPNTTESFTLNAVLDGQVKNTGSTQVTMAGVTNSDYSCAVTISGNCAADNGNTYGNDPGTLNGTGTTTLTTTTPSVTNGTTCNGGAMYIVSTITVNVACTYGAI